MDDLYSFLLMRKICPSPWVVWLNESSETSPWWKIFKKRGEWHFFFQNLTVVTWQKMWNPVAQNLEPSLRGVGRCSLCWTSHQFPMSVSQKGVYLGLPRKNREDILDSELWWILHSKKTCQGWNIIVQWLACFWVVELPMPLMSPAHSGCDVPAPLGPCPSLHGLPKPCMEGRTSQWVGVTAWQVQFEKWGNKWVG